MMQCIKQVKRKFCTEDAIMTGVEESLIKMLEGIQEDEDSSLVDIRITNAMQTSLVIEAIFRFLKLEDIKTCRYVCRMWNSIAEPLLRKRSKVVFDFDQGSNPKRFSETFDVSQSKLKFSSFSFSAGKCDVAEMKEFLQQQKFNIQALEFKNVISIAFNVGINNPCVNNWISDLPIKKLTILCAEMWKITSNLMVSLDADALPFAEDIFLEECKVLVRQGKKRITPIKIKLKDVTFIRAGYTNEFVINDVMNEILINNVIDLKKTKHIEIECPSSYNAIAAHIKLSLESCKDIYYLRLTGAKVVDWGSCNVKNLSLDGIPFLQRNGSKIDDLRFVQESIDLSAISPRIKSLWLGHWKNENTEILCSQPLNFPELKSLRCVGSTIQSLPLFKSCLNLESVSLSGRHNDLNTDWIPRNTKRLKITGIDKIVGPSIEINKLIVDCATLDLVEKIMRKVKPKELMVEWSIGDNASKDRIISFLEKYKDLGSISIGPFHFYGQLMQREYRLPEFVDEQTHFYVFKNMMGRGISIEEFNVLKEKIFYHQPSATKKRK